MMPDIFSSFDIYEFNHLMYIPTSLLLLTSLIMFIVLTLNLWIMPTRIQAILYTPTYLMDDQLNRTNTKLLPSLNLTILSLFILLIFCNFMGLIPYTFSITSHLIFTLALGFPLWLTLIASSFNNSKKEFTARLLPDGAPDWLNPFLVLIESISIMVRPLTLSFRLAANMSAGHIVLGLMGIYTSVAILSTFTGTTLLLLISSFYILFEMAICLIQAYIFCLLLSLYTDDHTT
nr:ATP synthase F0 subunit 6 [Ozobranchus jantseanus]